jgi:ABC-2 type transport system permease protein
MMSTQWRGAGIPAQVLVLTEKSLRKLVTDPKLLVFSVVQPLILLVLFGQIFSSIAATPDFPPGVTYIDFLVPAILVTTAMQSALLSGVGFNEEIKNGMVARLRSLPIWLGSVLVARTLFDLARSGIRQVALVLLAVGLFGFSPAGGVAGVLGALALALLIGWALGWIFLALACWLRNAEAMQGFGFVLMFPLMFASSAFVPLDGLPEWVRVVAVVNPMTYGVDAARSLSLGEPALASALTALVICSVIALGGAVLAVRGFRRPAS